MKKIVALVLSLFVLLASCVDRPVAGQDTPSTSPQVEPTAQGDAVSADGVYEIALITDVGGTDDKSFNEGTWNGVQEFSTEHKKAYNHFRPAEDNTEAFLKAIETAISKGAKVVVCPGYLFTEAVSIAQTEYPNIMFLTLDIPAADMEEYGGAAANTAMVTYREEQAGYLAGYAAVKDGYRKLGFLGGVAIPSVIRFGSGFVQGADAAAQELGADVQIKYWYSDSFMPTEEIRTEMEAWYGAGTEVVFACGGGIYLSAVTAASTYEGKVIGVDSDQAYTDPCVVTSAMKDLTSSVEVALNALYDNGGVWPEQYAGQEIILGAAEHAVGLPTTPESWRMNQFTVQEYQVELDKLISGALQVSDDISSIPAVSAYTTVEIQA